MKRTISVASLVLLFIGYMLVQHYLDEPADFSNPPDVSSALVWPHLFILGVAALALALWVSALRILKQRGIERSRLRWAAFGAYLALLIWALDTMTRVHYRVTGVSASHMLDLVEKLVLFVLVMIVVGPWMARQGSLLNPDGSP